MLKAKRIVLWVIILSFMSTIANAELIDRGSGLIYDTDLNVTWLQDANYADTANYTGAYHIDGRMQWDAAMTWADNLVYQGYSDWRLPESLLEDNSPCTGSNCWQTEALHLFMEEDISTLTPDPFINLQGGYWSQTEYPNNSSFAKSYSSSGTYADTPKTSYLYAMAVRDGDSTPEPEDSDDEDEDEDNSETDEDTDGDNIIGCFIASIVPIF